MPDGYELQLERPAQRGLEQIASRDYVRIEAAIDRLKEEPRPRGATKIQSRAPLFRIRVGRYRVLYAVFDEERIVKILQVSRRDEQTYRNLDR